MKIFKDRFKLDFCRLSSRPAKEISVFAFLLRQFLYVHELVGSPLRIDQ